MISGKPVFPCLNDKGFWVESLQTGYTVVVPSDSYTVLFVVGYDCVDAPKPSTGAVPPTGITTSFPFCYHGRHVVK